MLDVGFVVVLTSLQKVGVLLLHFAFLDDLFLVRILKFCDLLSKELIDDAMAIPQDAIDTFLCGVVEVCKLDRLTSMSHPSNIC